MDFLTVRFSGVAWESHHRGVEGFLRHPRTIEKRFGPWSSLPDVFRHFAQSKPEWADVVALLPVSRPKENRGQPKEDLHSSVLRNKVQHVPLRDRSTYGNPTHFRGLRHEPINEQGVVLLFGMLAKELGYMVEAVQTGFPDCEAKRQIGPERWQRVRIEFEFESRNFRDHGHPCKRLRCHCLLAAQLGRMPQTYRGRGAVQHH